MTAGQHRIRLLPCGDCATLVELPPDAGVLEFRADVAALGLAGVGELVPAARTLLVHHAARSGPVVRAALITLPLRERDAMAKTAPIQVSVRYDGADLAAVADEIGCSIETVIAQHQEPTYAVAFCGFAPGFAYLSGLPTALHLPRLATPRTRVPAGISRNRRRIQRDLSSRVPRWLAVVGSHRGDPLGCRPRSAGRLDAGPRRPVRRGMIEILAPGPLATIQDRGRPGYAHLGVGCSGAADREALDRANRLVGNDPAAAAIEVTLGGLAIRLPSPATVALTGAECPGAPGWNVAVTLPAGSHFALGVPRTGLRSYLAIRGGIAVPAVLGSRSTDTLGGLGPAALRAGDQVPTGSADHGSGER